MFNSAAHSTIASLVKGVLRDSSDRRVWQAPLFIPGSFPIGASVLTLVEAAATQFVMCGALEDGFFAYHMLLFFL